MSTRIDTTLRDLRKAVTLSGDESFVVSYEPYGHLSVRLLDASGTVPLALYAVGVEIPGEGKVDLKSDRDGKVFHPDVPFQDYELELEGDDGPFTVFVPAVASRADVHDRHVPTGTTSSSTSSCAPRRIDSLQGPSRSKAAASRSTSSPTTGADRTRAPVYPATYRVTHAGSPRGRAPRRAGHADRRAAGAGGDMSFHARLTPGVVTTAEPTLTLVLHSPERAAGVTLELWELDSFVGPDGKQVREGSKDDLLAEIKGAIEPGPGKKQGHPEWRIFKVSESKIIGVDEKQELAAFRLKLPGQARSCGSDRLGEGGDRGRTFEIGFSCTKGARRSSSRRARSCSRRAAASPASRGGGAGAFAPRLGRPRTASGEGLTAKLRSPASRGSTSTAARRRRHRHPIPVRKGRKLYAYAHQSQDLGVKKVSRIPWRCARRSVTTARSSTGAPPRPPGRRVARMKIDPQEDGEKLTLPAFADAPRPPAPPRRTVPLAGQKAAIMSDELSEGSFQIIEEFFRRHDDINPHLAKIHYGAYYAIKDDRTPKELKGLDGLDAKATVAFTFYLDFFETPIPVATVGDTMHDDDVWFPFKADRAWRRTGKRKATYLVEILQLSDVADDANDELRAMNFHCAWFKTWRSRWA